MTAEFVEELVELACVLHDTGKLARQWQERAWGWQRQKERRMRGAGGAVMAAPDGAIAHTWYDPELDREAQRKAEYHLPWHSVEGAYAVASGVCARLEEQLGEEAGYLASLAVVSAIARHHGPRSRELGCFRLATGAESEVRQQLPCGWEGLRLEECGDQSEVAPFGDALLRFGEETHTAAWGLYAFLVRRLRLADQAAVRRGTDKPSGE